METNNQRDQDKFEMTCVMEDSNQLEVSIYIYIYIWYWQGNIYPGKGHCP